MNERLETIAKIKSLPRLQKTGSSTIECGHGIVSE
jgi:hypothetical protein